VSVVLCAFADARWPDLEAAVESIRDQSPPAREIVATLDHNPALFACARSSRFASHWVGGQRSALSFSLPMPLFSASEALYKRLITITSRHVSASWR
jgi:hypothetical protein